MNTRYNSQLLSFVWKFTYVKIKIYVHTFGSSNTASSTIATIGIYVIIFLFFIIIVWSVDMVDINYCIVVGQKDQVAQDKI